MKVLPSKKLRWFVLSTWVAMLPLHQVLAANPQTVNPQAAVVPAVEIRDVALQPGGVLHGQVVDPQGAVCSHAPVRIVRLSDQTPVAITQADDQGHFTIQGLSGGVYRIETPAGASVYRLWASNTAPPSAIASALVVQGDSAMRGNLGGIGWFGWTLIGLGIAAAIAIPLALDKDKNDAS